MKEIEKIHPMEVWRVLTPYVWAVGLGNFLDVPNSKDHFFMSYFQFGPTVYFEGGRGKSSEFFKVPEPIWGGGGSLKFFQVPVSIWGCQPMWGEGEASSDFFWVPKPIMGKELEIFPSPTVYIQGETHNFSKSQKYEVNIETWRK